MLAKQKTSLKNKVLIWLPVILLPLVNIFLAVTTGADYDVRRILPWVIGAVVEELVFRFVLLKEVLLKRTKLKPILSILLVSLLFAVMHLWNLRTGEPLTMILVQMFFAFCFSIWGGAVVWRTDRIWIPLIAHVLLNATAVVEVIWVDILVGAVVLIDGILLMKGEKRL